MRNVMLFAFAAALLLASAAHGSADSLSVTTFHGNPARSGNYVVPDLTWANAAAIRLLPGWSGTVQGPVHAQPLIITRPAWPTA